MPILPFLLLTLLGAAPQVTVSEKRKLSADYAQRAAGRVSWVELSPDGVRTVFTAHRTPSLDHGRLYSTLADGSSTPVLLSRPMIPNGGLQSTPLPVISPDSSRVVYVADALADGRYELFSAPLDGSEPARRLNGALPPGVSPVTVPFALSADSARVVYVLNELAGAGLFSAPLDGSAPAQRIAPLSAGQEIPAFALVPDGTRAVYTHDAEVNNRHELYVVRLDGSAPPLKLNAVPPTPFVVRGPAVSPDSARVVYRQEDFGTSDSLVELFSVPLDGSLAPVRLNGPLVASGDVDGFAIGPDSARVVFGADALVNGQRDLFSAPLDGSAAAVRLNDDGSRPAAPFVITADSSRVLWNPGSTHTFFSAPLAAAGSVVDLGGPEAVDRFVTSPDGTRVVYTTGLAGSLQRLWSVPPDGSAAPLELSAATGPGHLPVAAFTPDGTRVLFQHKDEFFDPGDLYVAPSDGSAAAQLLASGLSKQAGHLAASDAEAFFVTDEPHPPLRRVPVDGSSPAAVMYAPPLVCAVGNVAQLRLGSDLRWVLYRGDQEVSGRFGLHSVRVDGVGEARLLTPALPPHADVETDFALDQGSGRALYRADFTTDEAFELVSVPVNGGAGGVTLSGPLVTGGDVLSFRAAGGWVAFRGDCLVDEIVQLFIVRVAGGTPIVLTPAGVPRGDVQDDYRFDAAATRILYRADQETNDVFELFALSSPGASVKVNAALAPGGDVTSFQSAPGGTRVVYRADQLADEQFELFTQDGAAAPVPLSPSPTQAARDVEDDFRFTPGGSAVVFRADSVVDERVELWRAPAVGGAATRLNGSLIAAGDVTAFRLSPDGQRVVYLADQTVNEGFAVYSRPLDASSPPVRLSPAPNANAPVVELEISPASAHVAFVVRHPFGVHTRTLYLAPIDGSAAAVAFPISPFSLDPVGHGEFRFAPDGAQLATTDRDRLGMLFAPVDAPGEVAHLPGGGAVSGFALTRRDLLVLDALEVPGSSLPGDGAIELFATPLARSKARRPR